MATSSVRKTNGLSLLATPHSWVNNNEPHPRQMRRYYDLNRLEALQRAGMDSEQRWSHPQKIKTFEAQALNPPELKTLLTPTNLISAPTRRPSSQKVEEGEKKRKDNRVTLMVSGLTPMQTKKRGSERLDNLIDSTQMRDLIFQTETDDIEEIQTKIHDSNDSRMVKALLQQKYDSEDGDETEFCTDQEFDELRHSLKPVRISDETRRRSGVSKPLRLQPGYVIALNPLKLRVDVLQTPLSPPRLRRRPRQMNPNIVKNAAHLQVESIKHLVMTSRIFCAG